jgi:hypothetical protein
MRTAKRLKLEGELALYGSPDGSAVTYSYTQSQSVASRSSLTFQTSTDISSAYTVRSHIANDTPLTTPAVSHSAADEALSPSTSQSADIGEPANEAPTAQGLPGSSSTSSDTTFYPDQLADIKEPADRAPKDVPHQDLPGKALQLLALRGRFASE